MTDLELIQEILEKPIAFHKVFFNVTKDVKVALFLSQLFYWSKKMKEDWFYKTVESWEEETGLTRYEQETAKKKLISLKLLQCRLKGMPAKQYFKFDFDRLITLAKQYYQLSGEKPLTCKRKTSGHVSGKLADMSGEKSLTIYRTENTTENTTEKKNTTSNEVASEKQKNDTLKKPKPEPLPVDPNKIVDLYHEILPELAQVKVMHKKRIDQIKIIFKNWPNSCSLDWWGKYFNQARTYDFVLNGVNGNGWRANFDYFIKLEKLMMFVEKSQ